MPSIPSHAPLNQSLDLHFIPIKPKTNMSTITNHTSAVIYLAPVLRPVVNREGFGKH